MKESLTQLHFIFTSDSFILDDTYHINNKDVLAWQNRFHDDRYLALYHFGLSHNLTNLSSSANFLHMLGEFFFEKLTKYPELELARENIIFSLDEDDYSHIMDAIPFVIGNENINKEWLDHLFHHLTDIFAKEITQYNGSVQMYLAENSQHLQVAERIYFHFVDHNDQPDFPFAFMATYASKVNGQIKHMPLKHALVEYNNDRTKLLSLLSCLNKVADVSPLIARFMESGEMFHPIYLTKKEAYELLKSIPAIEKCGIKCRVPNWWKKNYSKVTMSVSIGDDKPSLLGFDSLLQMQAKLSIHGVQLSEEDIQILLQEENDSLYWLKGQWIEINHQHLEELLQQIKNYDGSISLKEALSMQLQADKEMDVGPLITNGKWLNTFLTNLRKPSTLTSQKPPKHLNASLRPYQQEGYTWLNYMNQIGFGACLADDMGLGKTIQVLAFLENIIENNKDARILLIVPASLLGNWEKEIQRFTSHMIYFIMHGQPKKQLVRSLKNNKSFLTITTYGLAAKIEELNQITWDCIILDEAQAIKNPLTKQTKAIKKIPSQMRIAMTGTPIENELTNLWSLFDFLNKGLLGTSQEFKNFSKSINEDPHNSLKLRNMVSPFILRRLKTDKTIISDLPDKIEMIDYVKLTKKQTFLYTQIMERLVEKMDEASDMERRGIILSTLTKLKQVCNHPDQYLHHTDYLPKESGKFILLKEICETIYNKRERVLVFTQYKEICDFLSQYLEKIFHKKGFVLHGGTPIKKRQEIVEKFNSEDYYPYIVLSVKAAGTGLNLTAANHVIHFDRWWNPAVENQASDRAFRIGQKKNVFVHKFVSEGSVEEKIDQLINSKKTLADEIITAKGQTWITELNDEDLLNILKLEGDRNE